ncbi:MAG TPA: hypothetical protein VMZ71_10950, partial [Gemmataceae bacterium]|nr:hypothetical protein [Gemmataceae bacterium]
DRLGEMNPDGKRDGTPGDPRAKERTMLDDAKKRLESSQLQIEEFERNRFNKDLHDKLGWSQGDYDRFLEGAKQRTKDLEKEVVQAEQELAKPLPPPGAATQNVSGASKVAARKGDGTASVGGTTFAPPGFGKTAEGFRQDAQKFNSTPKK